MLKLLDRGIDFGDDIWVPSAPLGVASVRWSVGRYTADVAGTLHLDGVSGRSGRVHAAFFLNGELNMVHHSRIHTATNNGPFSRSVNLSPSGGVHITEVHVCTEISDDGVQFESVNCPGGPMPLARTALEWSQPLAGDIVGGRGTSRQALLVD